MIRLKISHRTLYNYVNPVQLHPHRFLCRPRGNHELLVIDAQLTVSPPAELHWARDVFGNSVVWLHFSENANQLLVQSDIEVEHYPVQAQQLRLDEHALQLPFEYDSSEIIDLQPYLRRHYPDADGAVAAWAQSFANANGGNTLATLTAMNTAVKETFTYQSRSEHGTWEPTQTLSKQAGSCRDFALLMMEAARSLGVAARFVSGYLYDGEQSGAPGNLLGGGETHAWLHLYLPGEGWVAFDPTNALVAGRNLIEVAVAREPDQAAPLMGGFTGLTGDYIGMTVEVSISESSTPLLVEAPLAEQEQALPPLVDETLVVPAAAAEAQPAA